MVNECLAPLVFRLFGKSIPAPLTKEEFGR